MIHCNQPQAHPSRCGCQQTSEVQEQEKDSTSCWVKFEDLDAIRTQAIIDLERYCKNALLALRVQTENFNRVSSELELMKATLSDPEAVLVNMMRGTIGRPSARSLSKLFGPVINGEEAQLLEITRLREELAKSTK